MVIENSFSTIYVAKPECLDDLSTELGDVAAVYGNLVFSQKKLRNVCFAQDIWYDPVVAEFDSISAAARILKQAGKYWFLNPLENVRRSHLITQELRKLPNLIRQFPMKEDIPAIGCFSLLDKNTIVYSANRYKKWPMGECQFIEDKINPPNRAYLKLWEALTLLGHYPSAGETVVDLGATPGGWTYVMQSFGAHVTAVDKAPLHARIARLPHVAFKRESAFALQPQDWDQSVDWLLCDVACYPDRLYDLVLKWLESGKARQLIFTIKLQGKTDFATLKRFQDLPHARVLNLFYNKHEATLFCPAPDSLFPQI